MRKDCMPSFSLVLDPDCGFRHLDPLPKDLEEFYKKTYYQSDLSSARSPDLKRLCKGGTPAERERQWLKHTLHADIAHILAEHNVSGPVLDVGCGLGCCIADLRECGYQVEGIELSEDAATMACEQGLPIFQGNLEDFIADRSQMQTYAAILMLNVLEHVPDPRRYVNLCHQMLCENGVLTVKTPNDFNSLQEAARRQLDKEPWWVAAPDHINYFSFESLARLLVEQGFEVTWRQADFPMSFFLLMGDNYLDDQELGRQCHEKRINLETALTPEVRRNLYKALANAQLGRNCLLAGRKTV